MGYRNDKIIPSVLLRVQNEIINVEAQKNEALANQKNAAAYFNFLLNRELESEIERSEDFATQIISEENVVKGNAREELEQLNKSQAINAWVVELEKAYQVPKVGLQVDVGSQNFDFEYGGYVLAGLSVEMPIYTGKRNILQVQQAELDMNATAEKIAQVQKQIELQTQTARNSMLAAYETWLSFQPQYVNTERQYRDTFRRYKEGISNYIEVLDARTQTTDIALRESLAMYTVLIKKAELERAMASYSLN